jgi:hypothetical protein
LFIINLDGLFVVSQSDRKEKEKKIIHAEEGNKNHNGLISLYSKLTVKPQIMICITVYNETLE